MRVKKLRLSTHLLIDFLKNPTPPGLTADGLPEDARIVASGYEDAVVILYIESASFEPVAALDEAREMTVLFTQMQSQD